VPLLLTDLDNTLIDRAGAFRRWAERYVTGRDGSPADLDWLLTADDDGFAARSDVAQGMRDRWHLPDSVDDLTELLLFGHLGYLQLEAEVITALSRATAAGWVPIVVTNGGARQQEEKLRTTGLDRHVAGWVTSGAAGVSKPDEEIFKIAAETAGLPLTGGWMVGDHPKADIGGGVAAGLSTAWIRRGREWPMVSYRPTISADGFPEAVDLILAA
jgi:putative hydrolase of the HAD superfamily